MDAPQALDAPVDPGHRHLRLAQLGLDRRLQALDETLGGAPLRVDLDPQPFIRLRFEIPERQLLELVLDLAHAEPVGDRGVDVARFLGDPHAPLLGQVAERPHVVDAVGQLDENDANVVDHREEHLAEVLRLAFLGR